MSVTRRTPLLNIPKLSFLSPTHMVAPASPTSSALVHTVRDKLQDVLSSLEASTLSTERKTKSLCQYYGTMIPADKAVFLKMLSTDYNINQTTVLHLAGQLSAAQSRGQTVLLRTEERLRYAMIPRYQQLFTHISRLENGVKFLVDLRTDLLTVLGTAGVEQDNAHLQTMSTCLRDLLALWFSVGFLGLERITWKSPGDMLQKISEYEAVHPIRNWSDLMRRVGPYRRCYVFTHASMPREPVVVLHTALTNDISNNIQSIVTRSRLGDDTAEGLPKDMNEDPKLVDTAIFYSITSTQKGLQGVEMGNFLIKGVIQELLTEFPNMHQFSSLSPIPGFKDWLIKEINSYTHQYDAGESPEQSLFFPEEISRLEEAVGSRSRAMFDALRKVLQKNSWVNCEQTVRSLKEPLLRLCARYLYVEKRRKYALNPVANFHLRNGAVLWRINWMGDTSPRGLGVACGLMVNYRYYLAETEENSKNYMENYIISTSEQFQELVAQLPASQLDGGSHKSDSPSST